MFLIFFSSFLCFLCFAFLFPRFVLFCSVLFFLYSCLPLLSLLLLTNYYRISIYVSLRLHLSFFPYVLVSCSLFLLPLTTGFQSFLFFFIHFLFLYSLITALLLSLAHVFPLHFFGLLFILFIRFMFSFLLLFCRLPTPFSLRLPAIFFYWQFIFSF